MIFADNKTLKDATIEVIKSNPRILFFVNTNNREIKKGLYIMLAKKDDTLSVSFNLTPLDKIFSFLTFVFIVSFLTVLLFFFS